MSIQDSIYRSAAPGDGTGMAGEKIYRVIFEGIKSDIETPDSFAIKYGLLTSTPVTKIKFMLRSLPKTILETKSAAKAREVLELLEEAGGVGMIEEYDPSTDPKIEIPEQEPSKAAGDEKVCSKCGFPLRDGDEFCQFCHTPLVETKSHKIKTILKAGGGGYLVDPKRLFYYLVAVLVILLLGIITAQG